MTTMIIYVDGVETEIDTEDFGIEVLPPAEKIYMLPKQTICDRMTDSQLDWFDAQIEAEATRVRRMWYDIPYLTKDHPMYAALSAAFELEFGENERDRLLADPEDVGS